ncbi:MAG: hypothetical protein FJ218_09765 [Ignavibacteria bacterium]|nr:hypothetical protein [Ignavibacteria bacterium]
MKNLKRIVIYRLFFFLWIISSFASAQEEIEHDTLQENEIEYSVEQIETDENDSPILEVSEENENTTSTLRTEIRSRVAQEIQKRKGFEDGTFLGTRLKSYQRIRVSQENISGGILFEKDAGEKKINDFTTGFVRVKNLFNAVSVILGDYSIEAGEGLSLWRGFGIRKSSDVFAPAQRNAHGIVPHLTSDEVNFFRGGAMQITSSQLDIALFFSQRKRDANFSLGKDSTTLYDAGYFRTENEIEKRSQLFETSIGGTASYRFSKQLSLGGSWYRAQFHRTLLVSEGKVFAGKILSLASLFVDGKFPFGTLFGEIALQHNASVSAIAGAEISPARNFRFLVVGRNYAPNFFSLHGLAFGERITTRNERGVYVGFVLRSIKRTTLSIYYDQFSFPQPTTTSIFPSYGNDFLFRADVRSTRKILLSLQMRKKNIFEKNTSVIDGISFRFDDQQKKFQYRCTFDYSATDEISFRERIEYVTIEKTISSTKEDGLLLYSDVRVSIEKDVSTSFRVVYFETDAYASRITEFEKDVDGALSIPSLYGKGIRWYVFLELNLFPQLTLQAKYGGTFRDDVKFIGSGDFAFPSNAMNALSMQLEWKM